MEVRPVTAERWPDLVELFGKSGASGGCWCMWFRRAPSEYWANKGAGNRSVMEGLVMADRVPGLIAYEDDRPVGWVSLAPRSEFERIAGPVEEAEDAAPSAAAAESVQGAPQAPAAVWSVVCFFIRGRMRGRGIATRLLDAAIEHARQRGARVLEAYPIEADGRTASGGAYTGLRTMFEKAGFREVGRFDRWRTVPDVGGPNARRLARPPGRPVMRLEL